MHFALLVSIIMAFSTRNCIRAFSMVSRSMGTVPKARIMIEPGKSRLFKEGNPLVFGGPVDKIEGEVAVGDYITAVDHRGNVIGRGFYNPKSMYRVRLVAHAMDKEVEMTMEEVIRLRVQKAVTLRRALQLPSSETTAYRLIYSEGDHLSGLVVDVIGEYVVVMSSAYWVEMHAEVIKDALKTVLGVPAEAIIWRRSESRLQQDGFLTRKDTPKEDDQEPSIVTTAKENGITFEMNPVSDQKTGFYCDQRSNRMLVRSLAKDKHVLDLYSYSGGFSFNALAGGAASVTAVDTSGPALRTLHRNLALNPHLDASRLTTFEESCEEYLYKSAREGKHFDMVICDPPKLAQTQSQLVSATRKYTKINVAAMSAISPSGGLLFTFTCSGAMTQSGGFIKMLENAAHQAGRRITFLSEHGAAPDHTVTSACPEGKYLTGVLAFVQ